MQTIEIEIGKLFDAIEEYEYESFIKDKFYQQKTKIEIQDENDNWIKINGLIKKEKKKIKFTFNDGHKLVISENHLLTDKSIPAKDFNINDIIYANNEELKIIDIEKYDFIDDVFDFEVNSETHLYKDAKGIVHHNSGKGKSLLLDVFLGENIRNGGASYKFDIEDAGGHEFTSKVVDSEAIASKIRIITPKNITKDTKSKNRVITIEKLNSVCNSMIDYQVSAASQKQIKSILVGIDSITQLTSVKEVEDNLGEKDKKDLTSTQKIREMFRVITQQQKQANMTIIGLAQLTANIGQMFGPTKVENAKGSGFKYASSLSLQATTDKELVKSVKGGAEIPIGIKMRFKTTKNRVEFKGRDAWVYFYFQSGIEKYGGLMELLSQYGVFSASSAPTVYGEYTDTTTFKWVHPDSGESFQFGYTSNNKGRLAFIPYMKSLTEEQQLELLTIWNLQINEVYEDITKDWDEAILLESDSVDDGIDENEGLDETTEEDLNMD